LPTNIKKTTAVIRAEAAGAPRNHTLMTRQPARDAELRTQNHPQKACRFRQGDANLRNAEA
jgi:hypothetical protein